MKSQLIIVPADKLLQKVVDVIGAVRSSVIYVSLSKTAEGMRKILGEGKKKDLDMFFIDCVSNEGKGEGVLYINPRDLDKLDYAIRSFKDEIEGDKVIVLDALSTLLIYNDENKVAAFVKSVVGYSQELEVSVLAFAPKTEEDELFVKIYNFFDEVEKK